MKDFFRHNGVLILIAAVLLALVTAVVSMLLGGTDPLSNLVGIVTTPVRNGISALAGWTEEQYADAFEREQLKSENAELKLRVAELEEQARPRKPPSRKTTAAQPAGPAAQPAGVRSGIGHRHRPFHLQLGVHAHHQQGQLLGPGSRRLCRGRILEPGRHRP